MIKLGEYLLVFPFESPVLVGCEQDVHVLEEELFWIIQVHHNLVLVNEVENGRTNGEAELILLLQGAAYALRESWAREV